MQKGSKQPIRRKRKYARFFDWHDKQRKELGIVEDFLQTMAIWDEGHYHSPQNTKKDPPDCILLDAHGNKISVEIRELVSEKAVRKAEQGIAEVKFWNSVDVISEINVILQEKDKKIYYGVLACCGVFMILFGIYLGISPFIKSPL